MTRTGTYRGVSWERHHWGVELVAMVGDGDMTYLARRKVAGNGSDPVRVRESVADFLADIESGNVI